MAWRGPRTSGDPSLSSKAWAKVKAHWIALRLPVCQATRCKYPRHPIDYSPPFTRPLSFSCGHIVSRRAAKRMGWSTEQTNALTNTRPEHRACNIADGARIGQKAQQSKQVATAGLDTSRRW